METTLPPPTVVKIPLSQLLPNPHQPRHRFKAGSIEEMAESLKAKGQETELKVRPLTEEEKRVNPGFEYLVIGGHRRLAGAKLAGFETLDCIIRNITPEETLWASAIDNSQEDMDWWDWDLVIEQIYKAMPEPSQRKLAAELGKSVTKVNGALKILGVLTPAARELVTQNLDNASKTLENGVPIPNTQNKGFLLTEYVLLALADLGDPHEVEKTLNRVLDDHMTEAEVRRIVTGLLKGEAAPAHTPANGKSKAPATPPSDANQPPTGKPSAADDGDSSKKGGLTGLFSGLFHPKSLVSAGLAGVVGAFLLKNLKRALGTLARRWMIHTMVGLGVVALLSPHLFVSVSRLFHSAEPRNGVSASSAHLPPGAQAGRQDLVVPSQGAEVNGGTKLGSAPVAQPNQGAPLSLRAKGQVQHPKTTKPKAAKAVVAKAPVAQPQALSPEMEAWAASDAPLAGEFASRFYGVSYMNWDGTMDYFKAHMTEDESPVFIQQYFPPTLLRQFQEKRLVLFFEASKPPQLVKVGGTRDEFLAQGTVTTKSYLNRTPQTLSKKPVALLVEIWHKQGFGTRVGKAAEVSPEESQTLSQNAPNLGAGNPKDSAQKDKTDQVGKIIDNAANHAVTSAVDDVIKKLPF